MTLKNLADQKTSYGPFTPGASELKNCFTVLNFFFDLFSLSLSLGVNGPLWCVYIAGL